MSSAHSPVAAGDGLHEPLPRPLARALRRAAWEHAVGTRQRVLVPQLHVGMPGEPHPVIPAVEPATDPDGQPDQALRADAVVAMRRAAGGPEDGRRAAIVWLVRTGPREAQDADLLWLGAAGQAFGEAGEPLVFVVVDRHGWWDPRSGLQRTWVRLRER